MNKYLEIFLGILTAMGGFVEIGEMVFTVDAGAKFGFRLLWVSAIGTLGIMVYGEMAGRIAAVSQKPVFTVIKDTLGYNTTLGTMIASNIVNLMTCTAEIGGVALVLKLAFGANYYLLMGCAAVFLLLVVAILPLEWIERTFGLLGLLMVVFIVAAIYLHPDWSAVGNGFIPGVPHMDATGDYYLYAYYVVALLSSIMLPYETYFYASGAIEDGWTPEEIQMNRLIVGIGFGLGATLGMSLIIVGTQLFMPTAIEPQLPGTVALGPAMIFGKWGLYAALGGMFFAFGGAAIETALCGGYNTAQFFGWKWGKAKPLNKVKRFTISWALMITLGMLIVMTGVDPIMVVEYSIIFAVVLLPLTYYPVLIAAGDKKIMGQYLNGKLANVLGWAYLVLVTIAAIAAIPLLIITHGGKG